MEDNLQKELYFLIAKFLKNSPCTNTFNTLVKEIESNEILPKRIEWTGQLCNQTFQQLELKYKHIDSNHLLEICKRINPLLENEFKRNIQHVHSLLGVDNFSVLRDKENKKRQLTSEDYIVRRNLRPPIEPIMSYKYDFAKVLYARQICGGFNRTQLLSGCQPRNMQILGRTLGHLSAVYCVLFDSSSRYIFTGADDLLVKIWHATSGRLLTTLRGASAEITDLAVNYENTLLAAGSVDKIVRVWCLQTAYPVATLVLHTGLITGVNFCPSVVNGCRYLASTATDGSVAFWKYAMDNSGVTSFEQTPVQYLERMRPGCAQILCGSFSAGGMFLATGSADHNVRVYKMAGLEGPTRVLEKEAHSDRVDSIQWANTHLKFLSGSKDGTSLIWYYEKQQWKSITLVMSTKLSNERMTEEEAKQKLRVTMLSWDKSDQWVITASSDNCIKVWDSISGQLIQVLTGHRAETYVVESHPLDSKILLSAGHDGKLILWDIITGEMLACFQNNIDGQGHGAVFDAKWSPDGMKFAATDSHGQILTFGYGFPDKTRKVPRELFFHTDYRPLTRDASHTVLDEQTQTPPHLMPPPFLVDIDGNPYPPYLQRLVPGREHCDIEQLVPNVVLSDEGRQEVIMAAESSDTDDPVPARTVSNPRSRVGMRRSGDIEGVRQSSGNWQRGDNIAWTRGRICEPMDKYAVDAFSKRVTHLAFIEREEYRRESKKPMTIDVKPVTDGPKSVTRRRRKAHHSYRTRASRTEQLEMEFENPENLDINLSSDSQDEIDFTARESEMDTSSSSSDNESSSDYSDWTADHGIRNLEPPKRTARVRNVRRATKIAAGTSLKKPSPQQDVPEEYRPLEWLSETVPQKAPYYPQMGDEVMFFQQGYNLYLNAVQNKNIYQVKPVQLNPWGKIKLKEPQLVKVIGIKYEIRPPRLCGLRLAVMNDNDQVTQHSFDLKYHDITDVIDFLVLRSMYDTSVSRNWKVGDRFRSIIDKAWWSGKIISRNKNAQSPFLCYRILWDNNEYENLSPWDLEPINTRREPPVGCSVPVLPREIKSILYQPEADEWPMGNQDVACERILRGLEDLMSMAIAEHFLVPVDISVYPSYAYVVEYPIDLTTIKSRFENRFYRRIAAAQFDARYIASNAEKFNEAESDIVRHARIVTDILLKIIKATLPLDVPALCRQLQENYCTSDSTGEEEASGSPGPSSRVLLRPASNSGRLLRSNRVRRSSSRQVFNWKQECKELLQLLWSSEDSEPFRQPVDRLEHPDYDKIIDTPMDLSIIREELRGDNYDSPADFSKDIRIMFQNAKNYTPNKKSRIYAMTVRLSSLAEEHLKRILSHWKNKARNREPLPPPPTRAASTNNVSPRKAAVKRRRIIQSTDDEGEEDDDDSSSDVCINQRLTNSSGKHRRVTRLHPGSSSTVAKRASKRERNVSARKMPRRVNSTESEDEPTPKRTTYSRRRNLRKRKMWDYAKMLETASEEEGDETDTKVVATTATTGSNNNVVSRRLRVMASNTNDSDGDGRRIHHRLRRRRKQCHYEENTDSMEGEEEVEEEEEDESSVNIRVSVSSRGRIRRLTAKASGVFRNI